MQRYTIHDFQRQFPDDAACLEYLRQARWPSGIPCQVCKRVRTHHRLRNRPAYSCDHCGHHVYPLAGTIFHKSATPLRSWFHAMFLMAQTRCGISAKQLERELGVTYKTAWRMFRQIRTLMDEDGGPLGGAVEADETYMGGRRRGKHGRPSAGDTKIPVLGVVERKGRIKAVVTKDATAGSLLPVIQTHVMPASIVYTDEWVGYQGLPSRGYEHRRVHHAEKVYVTGDAHTNTVEGFWSLVKRGISGVHHVVGSAHLQSYLNEYAFRWNHRNDPLPMFTVLLGRVVTAVSSLGAPAALPSSGTAQTPSW